MKILMIAPYYEPDLGPSAPLFSMLAGGLTKRGHRVIVLTTVPHYPSGEVSVGYRGTRVRRSVERGVEVIRVPLPSLKRANLWKRLLQFCFYQAAATWAGLGLRYDAAFVANPALWVWLPFAVLVAMKGKPSVFSVHDVYPDVGVALGIFRQKFLIEAVGGIERFCLARSSSVRILSNSFRPGLRRLGLAEEKMILIYDWVDTHLIRPIDRENAFAKEHGLTDKFVVLYAGNVGLSQGLGIVLDAAQRLSGVSDILFVFVGSGSGRARLKDASDSKHLRNVRFIPFQPRERLPEVLACASVSLVILRRGIGSGSLPSKIYSIMASGRPVLASVDEGSETWNLVHSARAGICVPPEDPEQLSEAILRLRQDRLLREDLGRRGRLWAEQHHSPGAAAERFESLLLAGGKSGHQATVT